jgi:hypothetical protein
MALRPRPRRPLRLEFPRRPSCRRRWPPTPPHSNMPRTAARCRPWRSRCRSHRPRRTARRRCRRWPPASTSSRPTRGGAGRGRGGGRGAARRGAARRSAGACGVRRARRGARRARPAASPRPGREPARPATRAARQRREWPAAPARRPLGAGLGDYAPDCGLLRAARPAPEVAPGSRHTTPHLGGAADAGAPQGARGPGEPARDGRAQRLHGFKGVWVCTVCRKVARAAAAAPDGPAARAMSRRFDHHRLHPRGAPSSLPLPLGRVALPLA